MFVEAMSETEWELELLPWQCDLLTNLVPQVRELVLEGTSPSIRRLFPTAYPSDAAANDAYDELVRDQLLESRLAALETIEHVVESGEPAGPEGQGRLTTLDEEELGQWMRAVNSIRLVLGTRLDVSEQDDLDDLADDDPDRQLWLVYHLLTEMLGVIIDAASAPYRPAPEFADDHGEGFDGGGDETGPGADV